MRDKLEKLQAKADQNVRISNGSASVAFGLFAANGFISTFLYDWLQIVPLIGGFVALAIAMALGLIVGYMTWIGLMSLNQGSIVTVLINAVKSYTSSGRASAREEFKGFKDGGDGSGTGNDGDGNESGVSSNQRKYNLFAMRSGYKSFDSIPSGESLTEALEYQLESAMTRVGEGETLHVTVVSDSEGLTANRRVAVPTKKKDINGLVAELETWLESVDAVSKDGQVSYVANGITLEFATSK